MPKRLPRGSWTRYIWALTIRRFPASLSAPLKAARILLTTSLRPSPLTSFNMLATVLRAVTPWCHSLLRSPFTNCGTWIDNPSATTHSAASSTLSPIDHIVQITSPTLTTIGKVSPWQVPTVATNESIRCQWETPSAPHAASLLPSPVDANRSQIPGGNVLALELPPVPSELPPKINQVTGWIEPVTPLPQVSRLVGRLHGETKDLQGDISEAGKLRMKAMSFWIVGFIYSLTPEGQGRGRPALRFVV